MSNRLKILSCGAVERTGNILNSVQVQILDIVTQKGYNILCEKISIGETDDYYRINVCGISTDDVLDTCIMDSTGGVFMNDDFVCDNFDDEIGIEITQLFTNYFIVE